MVTERVTDALEASLDLAVVHPQKNTPAGSNHDYHDDAGKDHVGWEVTAENDAQDAERRGKADHGDLRHRPDARRGDACRREKPEGFGRIARYEGAIASTVPAWLPPWLERLLLAEVRNEARARSCPGWFENPVADQTGADGKGANEKKRNPGRQQRLHAGK